MVFEFWLNNLYRVTRSENSCYFERTLLTYIRNAYEIFIGARKYRTTIDHVWPPRVSRMTRICNLEIGKGFQEI